MKQDFETIIKGLSVGQYLKINCVQNMKTFCGELGKIIGIYSETVTIEFVVNIGGHNGSGKGKEHHCWDIEYDNITDISIDNSFFYIEQYMK